MLKYCFLALGFFAVPPVATLAQNLPADIQAMKASYAASGSIVALDSHTLVIEPNMPGPVCALPKNEGGKTTWSYFAFPLASITVPLETIDETTITEDRVFTTPEAARAYRPGDVGDTTMVVVMGVEGRQFHTLMYDRDKLAQLGPGVHNSSDYGQAPDDVEAFGLTFADHAAAQAFVDALKSAVLLAKKQTVARAEAPGR
jgi:hypothetical protein